MKLKRVAVIFQNNIQYESFINAVDIMIKRGILVDLYVPINNLNNGFNTMFDAFYNKIANSKYNIYREPNDFYYDIVFETYYIEQFKDLKRKYTIKFMYGLTAKSEYSFSFDINYIFDAFLCYGKMDAICLQNYGKTFEIGNLKYLNTKLKPNKIKQKKTILYLPTYGDNCSIDKIGKEIALLNGKYDIIVKPHHGTEYLNNPIETQRMQFLKNNFNTIYSSKDSLEKLMEKCDLVISDLSGAVFDSICLGKPVIMFLANTDSHYGEYKSLPIQFADSGYILTIDSINCKNLEEIINKSLKNDYIKKQQEAFNILFCCKSCISGDKFSNVLDSIENGGIEDDYYLIHKQVKQEINNLKSTRNEYSILTKEYNDLINKNEILIQENNALDKKLSDSYQYVENLKNEINLLHNSTSWKITKPLRKFKLVIKKIIN